MIRIEGIRPVFDHILNRGKESPLTTTRDGFDTKHDLTQVLFKELKKRLEPIYRKEEERHDKAGVAELSPETKRKIQEAIKHLNKILADLMGEGEGGEIDQKTWKDVPIQFIPSNTRLTVGRPRLIHLILRTKDIKGGGIALLDSNNAKIMITPTSLEVDKSRSIKGFIVLAIYLKSDDLHEKATITAIVDGVEGSLEDSMTVDDVITAPILEPPKEMEFRPKETKGQPNRRNNLVLFINSTVIPIGRHIEFTIVKAQGSIGLLDDRGRRVDSLRVKFDKHHLVSETTVGRINVPWQGGGLGQLAKVKAETKTPIGQLVVTYGTAVIDQPEAEGGLIKDVKYRDLENSKCSDFADGIIYINSPHCLNREVFGKTQEDYSKLVKLDRTAQYRLSTILVEQSVFELAEDWYIKNKLLLAPLAPITSMREFVDEKTNTFAPRLLKVLIGKSESV